MQNSLILYKLLTLWRRHKFPLFRHLPFYSCSFNRSTVPQGPSVSAVSPSRNNDTFQADLALRFYAIHNFLAMLISKNFYHNKLSISRIMSRCSLKNHIADFILIRFRRTTLVGRSYEQYSTNGVHSTDHSL